MSNEENKMGRRQSLFLAVLGVGSASALVLGGCKGNSGSSGGGTQAAAGTGCDTPIDEDSRSKRRTFQYVEKAADAAKNCGACAQFLAGKYGSCGGCGLFSGPVKTEGGCLAFAPKAAGAPAQP
jgi:hypothetical protein